MKSYKYTINTEKININNPIYCYMLGLISTDGYIDNKNSRVCIRMRNEDTERVFILLKEYLEFTGPIFTYKKVDKELRISSKELIQNLTELGINKEKCNIPFLNLKGECMRLYLRGIHDGDGNVKRSFVKNKWRGGEYRLTNNNLIYLENLKKWMKENLNEVKTLNIRKVKRKSGIFNELSTGVKEGKEYCEWLYKGYEEYRLNCKYNKYKSITNDEIVQPA